MHDPDRLIDHPAAPATRPNHADRIRDWVELFRDIYKVAEALSRTAFVPAGMTGRTEDIAACMMKGFELGMDPLDALASMYVVHGKVGVTAEFMRRRIIQAGHTFKIVESTDSRAIVEATRREGGEPHRATFTAEQARKAGIDVGKYPADKLVARATSRLCRQSFPDVLSGSLLVEDLLDDAHLEEPPQANTIKRARTTQKPLASDTQPKELLPDPVDETADSLLDSSAIELATPSQKAELSAVFRDYINLPGKDDRREVIASIMGYHLDDPATMTASEASTITCTLASWFEDGTIEDKVNEIINTAILREEEKDA